jgi:glycosyltransferase involved in cell wall biosynthesis
MNPLITIITPAFNSEQYLPAAIDSVLSQSHQNWEWIIVDNGSTDGTLKLCNAINDPRIRILTETRKGAAHARNRALEAMNGDFFCFLDADDMLPKESLQIRSELLQHSPEINFVDGRVRYCNADGTFNSKSWHSQFVGNPRHDLCRLSPECFFGITWMFRRDKAVNYRFRTDWQFLEDRWFYIDYSGIGEYKSVDGDTYIVRRGHHSAMSNVMGLEMAYMRFLQEIKFELSSKEWRHDYRMFKRMFFKTYLRKGRILKAFRYL